MDWPMCSLFFFSLQECVRWFQTQVPLYGSLPISDCKVDFSPASVGIGQFTTATPTRHATAPTLQPAHLWINRRALFISMTTGGRQNQQETDTAPQVNNYSKLYRKQSVPPAGNQADIGLNYRTISPLSSSLLGW